VADDRPLSGRRAQAATNDEAILRAAREVFVADPTAPIAAVAERAGVGMSALYRRYASKEELLGRVCADGQETYLAEVERALADDGDPWDAFVRWLQRIVEADVHAHTVRLAGTFTPDAGHLERAERMRRLGARLVQRTAAAGALRPGLTFVDVSLLLELVSMTRLGDGERNAELRQRYLAVIVDGISAGGDGALPGRAPTWQEQTARWIAEPTG
jgi:AcrR family transcriptional regulator